MNLVGKLSARAAALWHAVRLRAVVACDAIVFDAGCRITTGVRIRATDGGRARFGPGVVIDRFADITARHGRIEVGRNTYVGPFTVIAAHEAVAIGENCLIAEHVTIRDQDHRFGPGLTVAEAGVETGPIRIEDNVWIGAKATITRGVRIGRNAVVGANAVVTRDVPADAVVGGIPARVIRVIA